MRKTLEEGQRDTFLNPKTGDKLATVHTRYIPSSGSLHVLVRDWSGKDTRVGYTRMGGWGYNKLDAALEWETFPRGQIQGGYVSPLFDFLSRFPGDRGPVPAKYLKEGDPATLADVWAIR